MCNFLTVKKFVRIILFWLPLYRFFFTYGDRCDSFEEVRKQRLLNIVPRTKAKLPLPVLATLVFPEEEERLLKIQPEDFATASGPSGVCRASATL